jgi:hypothetical protein
VGRRFNSIDSTTSSFVAGRQGKQRFRIIGDGHCIGTLGLFVINVWVPKKEYSAHLVRDKRESVEKCWR